MLLGDELQGLGQMGGGAHPHTWWQSRHPPPPTPPSTCQCQAVAEATRRGRNPEEMEDRRLMRQWLAACIAPHSWILVPTASDDGSNDFVVFQVLTAERRTMQC